MVNRFRNLTGLGLLVFTLSCDETDTIERLEEPQPINYCDPINCSDPFELEENIVYNKRVGIESYNFHLGKVDRDNGKVELVFYDLDNLSGKTYSLGNGDCLDLGVSKFVVSFDKNKPTIDACFIAKNE